MIVAAFCSARDTRQPAFSGALVVIYQRKNSVEVVTPGQSLRPARYHQASGSGAPLLRQGQNDVAVFSKLAQQADGDMLLDIEAVGEPSR